MAPMHSAGVFDWKRRMGVHNAYHRSLANRAIHWAAIPFELCAVVTLLAYVRLGPLRDAALVAIVLVAPIYLATELLVGALMVAFLSGCRLLAMRLLAEAPLFGVAAALVVFAVAFTVQVRVGHGVFEQGRDDTNNNLAELRATKNPIPILLVFYYHLVEIVLATGYRPRLKQDIDAFTAAEITRSPP